MHRAAIVVLAFLTLVPAAQAASRGAAALDEHGGPVKGIAVSADGTRALTASFDYSLILWDLPKRVALAHLFGHEAAVNAVAFLPGEERAVSVSDDGTLALWDLEHARLEARIEAHRGRATAVAVSPDGRLVATCGWDRTVRLWDLEHRRALRELSAADNLNAVAFSPDGRHLLAGTSDGGLQVFRVADGRPLTLWNPHDFTITALAVSPDGRAVATASVDETVQLQDLASGAPGQTLYGHEGAVLAVAFSPGGDLVASGGIDGTVRVWQRGSGDRLRVYERHGGPVWSVAFTPDGKELLSGGADGLVITYDLSKPPEAEPEVPTRRRVAALPAGAGGPGAALFQKCAACHTLTPDGGHRAGPTLYGLFGRRAGSRPGYPYSDALRNSHLVWNEETVSRLFEIGPEALVPGSKMPLQRMPNAHDRAELIDYLKQATAPDGRP